MEILQDINPGALVFYGLAIMVVASAAGVALSRNILYAGFSLLGTLGGVAGIYLYLGADFLGIAQLIIYVGGILVLILFAVLLTNRIGEMKITNASVSLPIGGGMAALLLLLLAYVATQTQWPQTEAVMTPTTARLGDAFLREYLLPFEIASVILLMALVGAMVIARRAAKEDPRPTEPGYERLV
jgi:NADH-quinone oxidoreductase subunit J